MKDKFPKELYVYQEQDGEAKYYIANKTIEEIPSESDGPVALYILKEVKELTTERILK